VLVVVLAVAVSVFWSYLYKRQGMRSSSYSSSVVVTPAPAPITSPPVATVPATPGPLPKITGRPLNLWVVGDAIARGDFASGPSTRYIGKLVSTLRQRERGPVQLSTSQSPLNSLVTVPSKVDVAVLEFGTYDIPNVGVAEFQSAYDQLTQAIRAQAPKVVLVCTGTWSSNGIPFDTVIAHSCAAAAGHYVPLRCLYATPSNRGPAGRQGRYGVSDDQAPNDAGHLAIAKAILHSLDNNPTNMPRAKKSTGSDPLQLTC
jgi:hypothetical protein